MCKHCMLIVPFFEKLPSMPLYQGSFWQSCIAAVARLLGKRKHEYASALPPYANQMNFIKRALRKRLLPAVQYTGRKIPQLVRRPLPYVQGVSELMARHLHSYNLTITQI